MNIAMLEGRQRLRKQSRRGDKSIASRESSTRRPSSNRYMRELGQSRKPQTVSQKIVDHLCNLSAEYRAETDPARKMALEKRILSLESYVIVLLSHQSRDKDRAAVVVNFAGTMLRDWQGTWDEYKERVDNYQKTLGTRSKGRPTDRRCDVAEALERKRTNPSKTWKQIAEDLNLNSKHVPREITRLRRLLRLESIEWSHDSGNANPSATATTENGGMNEGKVGCNDRN
jgi:hypothetical protein